MGNRLGLFFVCLFFCFAGCVFVVAGLVTLVDCRIAKSTWKIAPGHIFRYDISSNSSGRGKSWPAFKIKARYRYQVDGKAYDADKFGVGASEGLTCNQPDGSDNDFAREHPPRSPIDVYYKPSDPSQSALDLDPSVSTTLGALVGVAPISIGLAIFGLASPNRRFAGCLGATMRIGALAYGALVFVTCLIAGAPSGSYWVIVAYFVIVTAISFAARRGALEKLSTNSRRVTWKA